LLIADEPTGNLDEETANDIIDLFQELAHQENKCVIVVTHSQEVAKKSDRAVYLSQKKLAVKDAPSI
ncbi:TPA: ABC transporter ATP-binding protein, partial [Bacillus thuringiensis]|nr:ABC transporter ATP-binding protein [Bacillus thuringiensis]